LFVIALVLLNSWIRVTFLLSRLVAPVKYVSTGTGCGRWQSGISQSQLKFYHNLAPWARASFRACVLQLERSEQRINDPLARPACGFYAAACHASCSQHRTSSSISDAVYSSR
jgi:hypothetical protein